MLAPTTVGACGGSAQERGSVAASTGRGSWSMSISAALERHPNFDRQELPVFLPAQLLPGADLVVATVVATAATTTTALSSSSNCGVPVRAYPTLAQPGTGTGTGTWTPPPVDQWPSGWMPHHGLGDYDKAKAKDAQDAFALSLQLESGPEVPDQLDQVINFALQHTTPDDELLMAQIFADKRNQEAQQRASRERREQQARKGEEESLRRQMDQAVREEAARDQAARMREAKVRLAQVAAPPEPPPPSKNACLAPLAVPKALGKRKLVVSPVVEAETAPKKAEAAPKKVWGRNKKIRAKIVPPPQPFGGRSDWRISQDAVSIKLGICDEKDMLDRLHSLNPAGDKRSLVKHVQGFKNILSIQCNDFNDLATLLAWRQGSGLTLQATAHNLFALMYHELSETDPAETSHILDAVTLWTEGLGDGQGVCLLSQLCAMEA